MEAKLGTKELTVSSEAVKYEDEEWNAASVAQNFGPAVHDRMRGEVIWNCGVIAGTAALFRDLCLNVHLLCRASIEPYSDQAALNILLSMEPYRRLTKFNTGEDGWACHGNTFASMVEGAQAPSHGNEPAPVFDGDHVRSRSGVKYCVVHQYDRVPAWRSPLQERYAGLAWAEAPPPASAAPRGDVPIEDRPQEA
jgi:hypothetical protein